MVGCIFHWTNTRRCWSLPRPAEWSKRTYSSEKKTRQRGQRFRFSGLNYIILCIHHLNVVFLFPSVLSKLRGALWTVCAYLGHFLRPGMARSGRIFTEKTPNPPTRTNSQILRVGRVQSGQKPPNGVWTKPPFSGSDCLCYWPGSCMFSVKLGG